MEKNRELSAIMFTDIAGFTSLMGQDETMALGCLEHMRRSMHPLLKRYNGRMLKEMGDGTLCSFRSAVDAVECAMAIQRRLLKEADFRIRIGIHIGDVVHKGEDIFGDGVNVAARLEPLAVSGGICISASVYENIRNQTSIQTISLGNKNLKNVAESVHVYAVKAPGIQAPEDHAHAVIPGTGGIGKALIPAAAVLLTLLILTILIRRPPDTEESSLIREPVPEASDQERAEISEEIETLKKRLPELDLKIADIKTGRDDQEGELPDLLILVEEREKTSDRLELLRDRKEEILLADIALFRKIVESSSGDELRQAAWEKMTSPYPEAAGLPVGDTALLTLKLTGRWTDPDTGMEFVWLQGGCFQMGDNEGDEDERPVHSVCVDAFGISRYELTQGQWRSVMGGNPSRFSLGDNYPVERISWIDIQDFIGRLNAGAGPIYRLPTEAEWEFAAGEGGNDPENAGWNEENSGGTTHPVGSRVPNRFGLYDMNGNVWEWCSDWYDPDYYERSPEQNPLGPSSGSFRVIRDGCYNGPVELSRAAGRDGFPPAYHLDNLGFRLVITEKRP